MRKFILLSCFLLLSAPARWGIALNHQTKECAGYWAGDEYFSYGLPSGWKAYYPDNAGLLQTEIGSCQWENADWNKRAEDCCQQLGYTFVSSNIGKRNATLFSLSIVAISVCVILAVLIVLGILIIALGGPIRGRGFLSWSKGKKNP